MVSCNVLGSAYCAVHFQLVPFRLIEITKWNYLNCWAPAKMWKMHVNVCHNLIINVCPTTDYNKRTMDFFWRISWFFLSAYDRNGKRTMKVRDSSWTSKTYFFADLWNMLKNTDNIMLLTFRNELEWNFLRFDLKPWVDFKCSFKMFGSLTLTKSDYDALKLHWFHHHHGKSFVISMNFSAIKSE